MGDSSPLLAIVTRKVSGHCVRGGRASIKAPPESRKKFIANFSFSRPNHRRTHRIERRRRSPTAENADVDSAIFSSTDSRLSNPTRRSSPPARRAATTVPGGRRSSTTRHIAPAPRTVVGPLAPVAADLSHLVAPLSRPVAPWLTPRNAAIGTTLVSSKRSRTLSSSCRWSCQAHGGRRSSPNGIIRCPSRNSATGRRRHWQCPPPHTSEYAPLLAG
ncbi:ATP-dependent caseinolytic (Clp)protease/crotonase family protein [Striga asiatica]|uniref:ATP-dependent caseinolytic (Clp)protease/crotonase family protein n=1 Tax=Striga asiatica TaxID=4170 RepID=A0A5A7RKV7_STRAF|nr:ATP-dependent caseinolytic (Clp)protease/crotonase family protein [Striga asiatica]